MIDGLALTLVAILAQTLGNISLSVALRRPSPQRWGWSALALALLAGHFYCWSSALRLAPLAVLVPLTSLSHVLNALLVGPLLGEQLTGQRWLGTVLITGGVLVILQ